MGPTEAPGPGSLGVVLRRYRERALLSQEQLAERAGLSARAIRDLELGRTRRPHGSSVRLLADALRLDASERVAFQEAARADRCVPADPHGGDPTAMAHGGEPARPAQLPADVADFTGREALTDRLRALLDSAPGRPGRIGGTGAVTVVVITGPGGVGKTALAVHLVPARAGRGWRGGPRWAR